MPPCSETSAELLSEATVDQEPDLGAAGGAGELTVLIPTYRRPRLLERAVRSVLGQEYPHVRACVFDNASGDETASVIARLQAQDERVRYHCHAENLGIAANFEHALASVETPLFSILCDDDFLLPGFAGAAVEAFTRYPDAAMACCDVLQMNPRGDVVRERAMAACPAGRYGWPDGLLTMVKHGTPTLTGVVFRKEVIAENRGFDQSVGAGSDVDYVLRIAARHPFVLSHVAGAVFAPASIADVRSPRGSLSWYWPGWMTMVERLAAAEDLSPVVASEVRAALVGRLAGKLFFIGSAAAVRGDFAEARATAAVLAGSLQRRGPARAISLLAGVCEGVPGAHAVARTAFRTRAAIRHGWHRLRAALLRPDPDAWRVEQRFSDSPTG